MARLDTHIDWRELELLKKIFGFTLLALIFALIAAIAFPSIFEGERAGRVEKSESIELSFLKNESADKVLVYFGYVGCSYVCYPSLVEIAEIHKESKNKPSVWFVNMTPKIDQNSSAAWVASFNEAFKSYSPNKEELSKMVATLGLIYADLGIKAEHAPYLYLFKRDSTGYLLKYIYTSRPYNKKLILKDLNQY